MVNSNYIIKNLKDNNIDFELSDKKIIINCNPKITLNNFYNDEWSLSIQGYETGEFFHTVEEDISDILEVVLNLCSGSFKIVRQHILNREYLEVYTSSGKRRFLKQKNH